MGEILLNTNRWTKLTVELNMRRATTAILTQGLHKILMLFQCYILREGKWLKNYLNNTWANSREPSLGHNISKHQHWTNEIWEKATGFINLCHTQRFVRSYPLDEQMSADDTGYGLNTLCYFQIYRSHSRKWQHLYPRPWEKFTYQIKLFFRFDMGLHRLRNGPWAQYWIRTGEGWLCGGG